MTGAIKQVVSGAVVGVFKEKIKPKEPIVNKSVRIPVFIKDLL